MALFKLLFKVLAYPVTRPMRDIRKSGEEIKRAVEEAKSMRARREDDARVAREALKGKSGQEKFQEIALINGWTDRELQEQQTAARNTRLAMLGVFILGLLGLLVLMFTAPYYMLVLIGAMMMVFLAFTLVVAARYAWWEAQIAERAIFPFKDFLGRATLFATIFRK
jgi:hypothetical protein